jgi:hypothetical protein
VSERNFRTIPPPLGKAIKMLDVNPGDTAQPIAERWRHRSQAP